MKERIIEESDLKEFIKRLPDLSLAPPSVHLLMLAGRSRKELGQASPFKRRGLSRRMDENDFLQEFSGKLSIALQLCTSRII